MASDKSRAMIQFCDLTECCICLKTFTDPRMLPCIHTFCFQCLQDLAERSNKRPGDQIQCPVCRNQFIVPSEGVQGVQKNFFMASFIEVRNALNQSKMTLPCDICKDNNDSTDAQISEATMQCLVCQKNLCEGCCKMHKSLKLSRNHEIRKIGSEVGDKEVMKTEQLMNCDIHRGKPIDYYCADCKKVVCVSCFVESHKAHDCKDVNTVEKEFRQRIKSKASITTTLAEELLSKKKPLETKDDFLSKMTARESEILQRSKKLKDLIDEHTKSLLSSLHEIKNRHLKEIQEEEEELERRYTILESLSRYCDELTSKGSAGEVCRNKDELLRRADELEEDHEAYVMRPRVLFDVTFKATEFASYWPKTTNANIVGNLKENIEQLKDVVVMITDRDTYKINLRHQSETASRIENMPFTFKHVEAYAVAVYNNTMFIPGVGDANNEIWKYSFASGWMRCGSLVQGREGHCAEFIGETLYICGGRRKGWWGTVVMDSIEEYNALTEKSATNGQLKVSTESAACVAYKGSMYVFGGKDRYCKFLDCVQMYNPVERICSLLLTPLSRPSQLFQTVLWDNYAILFDYNTCFILNLDEKTLQERQQFKADADYYGVAVENGRIFIFRDDVRYVRASSIVNNELAKWRTHSSLPEPAHKPSYILAVANLTLRK